MKTLDYNKAVKFRKEALFNIVPPQTANQCILLTTLLMHYAVDHDDAMPTELKLNSVISELSIYRTFDALFDIPASDIDITATGPCDPKFVKVRV